MTETTTRTTEQAHYIYRWYDAAGVLLYVGVTTSPEVREASHRLDSWWFRWAVRCEVAPAFVSDRAEAERRERAVIEAEGPVFNKRGARGARERAAEYLLRIGEPLESLDAHFPPEGRPPVEDPRRNIFRIRLTDAEDAVVAAAAGEGTEVSPWARAVLLAAARRELAKRRRAG